MKQQEILQALECYQRHFSLMEEAKRQRSLGKIPEALQLLHDAVRNAMEIPLAREREFLCIGVAYEYKDLGEIEQARSLLASLELSVETLESLGVKNAKDVSESTVDLVSTELADESRRRQRVSDALTQPKVALFETPLPVFNLGQVRLDSSASVTGMEHISTTPEPCLRTAYDDGCSFDVPSSYQRFAVAFEQLKLQVCDEVSVGLYAYDNVKMIDAPTIADRHLGDGLAEFTARCQRSRSKVERRMSLEAMEREVTAARQGVVGIWARLYLAMAYLELHMPSRAYVQFRAAAEKSAGGSPEQRYHASVGLAWILNFHQELIDCKQHARLAFQAAREWGDVQAGFNAAVFLGAIFHREIPGCEASVSCFELARGLLGLPAMHEVAIPVGPESHAGWERWRVLKATIPRVRPLRESKARPQPDVRRQAIVLSSLKEMTQALQSMGDTEGGDAAVLQRALEAVNALVRRLQVERTVQGMASMSMRFGFVIDDVLAKVLTLTHPDACWTALDAADLQRGFGVGESLHRGTDRDFNTVPIDAWQSSPAEQWSRLSKFVQGSDAYRRGSDSSACPTLSVLLTKTRSGAEFFETLSRENLLALLPDQQTVLVSFNFHGEDLIVFAVIKDGDDELRLLSESSGPMRLAGRAAMIDGCLREHDDLLDRFVATGGLLTVDVSDVYRRLSDAMELPALLRTLSLSGQDCHRLHCVVVPDRSLYRIPLHALPVSEDERLIDAVASIRYGVSVKALSRTAAIRPAAKQTSRTKGVAFACPNRPQRDRLSLLDGVYGESLLLNEALPGAWWLHSDEEHSYFKATRENFRSRYRSASLLWFMGHAGRFEVEVTTEDGDRFTVTEPALLFEDGPLGASEIRTRYDFTNVDLFYISACLAGRLENVQSSKEVVGFVAALAGARARRVVSALWPIVDSAAAVFSGCFARAMRDSLCSSDRVGPNAYATALKKAIVEFRSLHNGAFANEFYWAGYVLYGLG